jgi:hypothetical protein
MVNTQPNTPAQPAHSTQQKAAQGHREAKRNPDAQRSHAHTDGPQQGPDAAGEARPDAAEARRQSGATGGAEPTEAMRKSNPPRSNEHPGQSAEVPLGTGDHAEPPGGGGRESQRKQPDTGKS